MMLWRVKALISETDQNGLSTYYEDTFILVVEDFIQVREPIVEYLKYDSELKLEEIQSVAVEPVTILNKQGRDILRKVTEAA